ncbi:hypothetical protein D3C77_670640 [compost metagenome]
MRTCNGYEYGFMHDMIRPLVANPYRPAVGIELFAGIDLVERHRAICALNPNHSEL